MTTAFLNADLNEKVYMRQAEGLVDKERKKKVCLLKRAIYGLKQASRACYEKVHSILVELKFRRSESEHCVYYKLNDKSIVIIALYVDDFLIFSNDEDQKNKLEQALMNEFEIKGLGEAKHVLWMRIRRTKDAIVVDQTKYIEQVLSKLNMTDCKSVGTPLEAGKKLIKAEVHNDVENDKFPYRELLGCLMYLAVCSRPDIAYASSLLSQFNSTS